MITRLAHKICTKSLQPERLTALGIWLALNSKVVLEFKAPYLLLHPHNKHL